MPPAWTTESFFAAYEPPAELEGHLQRVRAFLQRHEPEQRKIVLVTVRERG